MNQMCSTMENVDLTKIVYDCTSILVRYTSNKYIRTAYSTLFTLAIIFSSEFFQLNTDELLPHNICTNCSTRLTEFKTFRDYCLKNDELIRLHSLIHCDDGEGGVRPDGESVNDENANDLQDITDYVRDELQEELNLKGADFIFDTNGEYVISQDGHVDRVIVEDANNISNLVDEQSSLVFSKRKGERPKEAICEEVAEQSDGGGIVSILINLNEKKDIFFL